MNVRNSDKFVVKRLVIFDKNNLKDLNNLLLQWSETGYQIKPFYYRQLIYNSYILALFYKKRIVGTVTLAPMRKLSGLKGFIDHLIVDEKYRGRKLGKKLMVCVIDLAKKLKMDILFLTSRPERKIANILYKKLGFKIKKTNFYFLELT